MLGRGSSNRVYNINEKALVGWSSANKQEQERDYWQWGGQEPRLSIEMGVRY